MKSSRPQLTGSRARASVFGRSGGVSAPPRWSRRQVLRGAGVALSLPLMHSLLPRAVRAQLQQQAPPRRYISLYFPNGTAAYWRPSQEGQGAAWGLSPILEPLQPVKPYLSVLTNVSNYSPFGGHVEPSHSNCCASAWTAVRAAGPGNNDNGISVDQVIAQQIGQSTPLDSIQVGLSTLDSSPDGLPGQHSRSISWRSPTEPLYKIVNPQALFERLTGDGLRAAEMGSADADAAERRRALQKSVLDAVLGDASSLQQRLGRSDRLQLDRFMTSVRELEQRIDNFAMPTMATSCGSMPRPSATYGVGDVPADYNRNAHADLMLDLVVMAFECDITRVCSFMLDDARSDFVYDFLPERVFTQDGSTEGGGRVAGYHGLQHAGDHNNGFATITHWNAQKAAQLAGRLAAIPQADGGNMLDHSVIVFASSMHGGNHDPGDLPLVLIGGGGRTPAGPLLKQDRHRVYPGEGERFAGVHLTLMQHVYGCPDTQFGTSQGTLDDLLA